MTLIKHLKYINFQNPKSIQAIHPATIFQQKNLQQGGGGGGGAHLKQNSKTTFKSLVAEKSIRFDKKFYLVSDFKLLVDLKKPRASLK